MEARVAALQQLLESTPAEELKQKLLLLCASDDGKKLEALCLLFPGNTNFTSPPAGMKISDSGNNSPKTRKRGGFAVSAPVSPVTAKNKTRTLTIDQEATVTLKYIIEEPTLCQGFRLLLEKQFAGENLAFYKTATHFRRICSTLSPDEQLKMARQIFDEFVSITAPQQVNLNCDTLNGVKHFFERNGDVTTPIPEGLFDQAIAETENILETDCYPRFLKSKQFIESKALIRKIRCLTASIGHQNEDNSGLTARQWKILTSDAKLRHFTVDEVIVPEGEYTGSLYRLKRGKLGLYTTRDNKMTCIGEISDPGAVVGELSVAGYARSVATLISKDANTEIYDIDIAQFVSLLQTDENLALRFFKQLARKIGNLLFKQSAEGVELNQKDWESSPWLENSTKERNYQDDDLVVFTRNNFPEIPTTELPVKMFMCLLETYGMKSQSKSISVLITQNYMCMKGGSYRNSLKEIFLLSQLSIKPKRQRKNTLSLRFANKKINIKLKDEAEFNSFISLVADRKTLQGSSGKIIGCSLWFSMSPDDWKKILNSDNVDSTRKESCILSFAAGDVILRQGQPHCMLAQILKGSCSITPKHSSSPTAWLGSGEMIGEVEFLAGCSSVSTIIASEVNTTVIVLDRGFIKDELPTSDPILAAKFYRHLAQALGIRFHNC